MSTQVRVIGHYRVLHNGQAYTAGDGVVEVPDRVAKRWALYGWAEPVADEQADEQADDDQTDADQADAEQPDEQAKPKPKRQRRSSASGA